MERPTDAELMRRVGQGDQRAFAGIVDRYKDRMVDYLTRLTGSRAGAEDLAQEAFVRLYHHRSRYRETGQLGGYLFRIATNLARTAQRKQARRRLLRLAFLPGGDGPPLEADPHRAAAAAEVRSMLAEALGRLPLRYRVPLVLYAVEGMPYDQIASVIGCREGTVKSRISRGRALLRKKLPARAGQAMGVG